MSTTTTTTTPAPRTGSLDDPPVPVKVRLAAAWASFMLFYIYVDYLHLYRPGALEEILAGRVFEFEANQTFAATSLVLVGIPALMIAVSAAVRARANRLVNLGVAALYIPVSVFNLAGESWVVFYGIGVLAEVALLAFILRAAWTWPRSVPAPGSGL